MIRWIKSTCGADALRKGGPVVKVVKASSGKERITVDGPKALTTGLDSAPGETTSINNKLP